MKRTQFQILLGAVSFAATAIAVAPAEFAARLALKAAPQLEIASASGTIWNGDFEGVSFNRIYLGDVAFRVRPAAALAGKIEADVKSRNGALESDFRLAIRADRISFLNVAAKFDLASIREYSFFGARYRGAVSAKAREFTLTRTGCAAADVKLSTDVLDTLSSQWLGERVFLNGGATCAGDRLQVKLAGASGGGSASVVAEIRRNLAYSLELSAEPSRKETARSLERFGFRLRDGRFLFTAAGELKGLSS